MAACLAWVRMVGQMARVLVVEDNAGIREVVEALLRQRGHDVIACSSAEEALAVTDDEAIPIVVLDWGLPGMDGLELCRRLRARPGGEESVILVLTGHSDREDVDAVVAAGANDYLTKPFRLEWLEARIALAERQAVMLAERAKATEALCRNEAWFRSLVQHSGDVISVVNREGVRTWISPSVERVLGYPPEAMINVNVLNDPIRDRENQERLNLLYADALAHPGQPVRAEIATRAANGSVRTFEVIATNLLDDPAVEGIILNARDITDRLRVEAQLEETDLRFRTLIEQIPAVTYLMQAEGEQRILYISPQMEAMFGYPPSRSLENPNFRWEIMHPDDVERIAAEEERIAREQAPYRREYRQRRSDGSYFWVRDEAVLVRDAQGRPLYWQGVIFDITEQRAMAEALRESERQQRKLREAAERQARELHLLHEVRTAIAREMDVPTVIRAVVEAVAHAFGYRLVSVYLLEHGELVLQHQIGYPQVIERIPLDRGITGRVARTGQPVYLPYGPADPDFLAAFDGVVSEVCVPLHDEGRVAGILNLESTEPGSLTEGDLRLMLALAEHVSSAIQRARLYKEARESERRYRTVVESVHEVIFQTDCEGRWTFLNPAWTELTGFAVEACLGKNFLEFFHPDDRADSFQSFCHLLADNRAECRRERRIVTATGVVRVCEVRARALLDGNGSVTGMIGTLADVTDRYRAEEALRESQERYRHLALHDPLTGLANRAYFMERLEEAVAASARLSSGVAVLFLDLDGFKLVNDTLGHDTGDRLLVEVAKRLQKVIRGEDIVARLGGDEFAVLLHSSESLDAVAAIARRLIDVVQEPYRLDGQEVRIGVSIGVAQGWNGRMHPRDLLRNADIALYEAKGSGRRTFAIYEPRMAAKVRTRLKQETDIRLAIERNQLCLHYQPIFDLEGTTIVALEALVRWQHPKLGMLPASQFIHIAEASGSAAPLGEWVLREACRAGKQWLADGARAEIAVAVNVSARHLEHHDLAGSVSAILDETGLRPELLELELTGDLDVLNREVVQQNLMRLRGIGVRLVIDDFGTGHSSFDCLRAMPFDGVKLDRHLIAAAENKHVNMAVVRSISWLAHELGMHITAKGIESDAQLDWLKVCNVDRGQGYWFARPMPEEELRSLLSKDLSISMLDWRNEADAKRALVT